MRWRRHRVVGVDHILAGRAVPLSNGEWTGEWAYLNDEGRSDRSASAPSGAAFAQQGAALVAEAMASRYAVAATRGSGGGNGILMTVSGVQSYGTRLARPAISPSSNAS